MDSLIRATSSVFSSVLFCAVFWMIFGIVGMSLFSGRMHRCVCVASENCDILLSEIRTKTDCEFTEGLEWENSSINFDNIFKSIHSLFYLATLVGWSEIMYICVNSTGPNTLPEPYHNPAVAFYFVLVVLMCSFFSLNLVTFILGVQFLVPCGLITVFRKCTYYGFWTWSFIKLSWK